jgi:hypothetical protein
MTITDALLITVTLLSPVIAVQVQKLIERVSQRSEAQHRIFRALMATRATRVVPEHVQALNMIDLEFSGSRWRGPTPQEREVINKWRLYGDQLNIDVRGLNEAALATVVARREELFIDLLEALSGALGYDFDRVRLMRGAYYPQGHADAETRRQEFETALIEVVTGRAPLSMKVTEFPVSPELVDLQKKLQEGMLSIIDEGSLKVRTTNGSGA